MKLIKITDENKYEIVSKLREYKHQIFDLTPQELDIVLPQIKGYIFSITKFKESFQDKLEEYNEAINDEFCNEVFLKYISFIETYLCEEKTVLYKMLFRKLKDNFVMPLIDIPLLNPEDLSVYRYLCCIDLFFIVIFYLLQKEEKIPQKDLENIHHLSCAQVGFPFNITLDFKIFEAEEFVCYEYKQPNFLKFATNNVLYHLENIALNNEEEAKQINEETKRNLQEKALSIPRRLKNEHLDFMNLRKMLENNKYKEIAKKLDGKYGKCTENTLKGWAKEINDALGTSDIDQAIRNFESQYGAL